MSNQRYGPTGINGVQTKQQLVCRDCGAEYLGHHLTKQCDDCRFKECKAPGCENKIKKSVKKSYCSAACKASDPTANKMSPAKRKQLVCACGKTFQEYSGSGRQDPGSRRKYCSPECRAQYSHVGDRLRNNPELARQIGALKKPNHGLRGYKQSVEHLLKRLGANGSIVPSKEELSLIPTLAKYGFRHTGDGTEWRRWRDGTVHNPDFLHDERRIVFEYFGTWYHQDDIGREPYIIDQWRQIGYDCIIIWCSDRQAFLDDPAPFLDSYLNK